MYTYTGCLILITNIINQFLLLLDYPKKDTVQVVILYIWMLNINLYCINVVCFNEIKT